jgi:hypothetical protein
LIQKLEQRDTLSGEERRVLEKSMDRPCVARGLLQIG